MHVVRGETDMKKVMIIVGLVVALAIPTAAVAAGHRTHPKAKSGATTTAPKARAKGSSPRSGVTVKTKPSKNVPESTKTKTKAKPKAGTHSGGKPKASASGGTSSSTAEVKPNRTAGTPGAGVTMAQRGGSAAAGKQGIGGIHLPISVNGTGI
jgi:hypothetical protein